MQKIINKSPLFNLSLNNDTMSPLEITIDTPTNVTNKPATCLKLIIVLSQKHRYYHYESRHC